MHPVHYLVLVAGHTNSICFALHFIPVHVPHDFMVESGSFPCGDSYPQETMTMLVINAFLSLLTVLISIASTMAILRQNKKRDPSDKIPAALYYAHLCFYCLCAVDALCRVPDIIVNCYPSEFGFWWRQILQFLYFTCYIYHWIALLAILFLRLKVVFHGSPFEVNPCYIFVSVFIAVFITVVYAINYVAMIIDLYPYSFVVMFAGIITFILLIYSQILAFSFVRKLYRLNTMATRDDYLIATMTRYYFIATMCTSIATMYSSICMTLYPLHCTLAIRF